MEKINFVLLVKWIIVIALILYPTSKLINYFINKNNDKKDSDKNGELIGYVERIILLICIANNHYEALGFIITAKTLTRFKLIEEDKKFGEKYLLGTLLSVASVMVVYYLVIGIW